MQRFLESLNGVEIWLRMLHNCEWECWLDSCQSLTSTTRMIGHKRSFLKKLAALRLLHPSWWRGSWMEGNNWAETRCTTYRDNCNLERIVRESPFKNMGGKFMRNGLQRELKGTIAYRCIQDIDWSCPGLKPLLNQRHLTWAEDKQGLTCFTPQWSKWNYVFYLKNHSPRVRERVPAAGAPV